MQIRHSSEVQSDDNEITIHLFQRTKTFQELTCQLSENVQKITKRHREPAMQLSCCIQISEFFSTSVKHKKYCKNIELFSSNYTAQADILISKTC